MPYSSVDALPDYIKKLSATKQRQWMHVFNSAYSACSDSVASAKECESQAFAKANGVVKGSELPMMDPMHNDSEPGMQLEKADSRVNYRECVAGDAECCGSCRFFDGDCMSCDLVEGTIDAAWKCNLWTAQLSGMLSSVGEAYREPTFQVFVETSLADLDFTKPQWIPFLPVPGKFNHPKYGEIVVTPGQNREMVDSVKNHVYQEHIPIDAEHETKLSGAVGWLQDMRMNDNGSADALVEFTTRGQQLLKDKAFKYVSPEWFSDWRDPATSKVHRNVIAGGAITTRPFFKDKVLRALVANEAGSQIIGGSPMPDKDPKAATDPKADPKADTDPKADPAVKTFTEAEHTAAIAAAVKAAEDKIKADAATEANKTFTERLTAAETATAAAEKARIASDQRVASLEAKDRLQRFTDLVAGRGGAGDGAAWAGDSNKHVQMLEALATKVGEGDPIFTNYVEQQNAVAAQLKESNLFTEVGSSVSGLTRGTETTSSEDAKLDELAKQRYAKDPAKSYQQHYAEVLESSEGKALYGRRPAPKQA